jgi:hypothetical protein
MSLCSEQYRSLIYTRKLLRDMCCAKKRPKTVKELKERAFRALRHFPELAKNGEPMFRHDESAIGDVEIINRVCCWCLKGGATLRMTGIDMTIHFYHVECWVNHCDFMREEA